MIQITDFRGSDLPSWLHFDDKKLQVRGTPPTQQETSSRTLEAMGGGFPKAKVTPPVFMECMLYNAPLLYIVLNIHIYLYIYVCIYIYVYVYV